MDKIIEAVNGSGRPDYAIKSQEVCNASNGYMFNNTCFVCTSGHYADPVEKVCRTCNGVICKDFCSNGSPTCVFDNSTRTYTDTSCTDCGFMAAFGWTCQHVEPGGRMGCRFDNKRAGLLVLAFVITGLLIFSLVYLYKDYRKRASDRAAETSANTAEYINSIFQSIETNINDIGSTFDYTKY